MRLFLGLPFEEGAKDRFAQAQGELKKLAGECGVFDCITDEEISANAGKSWQELNTLRDPLLGLE